MDGEAFDVQPPDPPLAVDNLAAAAQDRAEPLAIPKIAPLTPDVGLAVATHGLPKRRWEACQPAKAAAANSTYVPALIFRKRTHP
jgi:hypothetical protein